MERNTKSCLSHCSILIKLKIPHLKKTLYPFLFYFRNWLVVIRAKHLLYSDIVA